MNVWVVSYDESENADDPLLRVFSIWSAAENAIKRMAPELVDELDDVTHECSILRYDPETGERVQLHVREVRVERPTVVPTSEVL